MASQRIVVEIQKVTDRYLTVEDAAAFMEVKEQTVRDYLSRGKLTTYKYRRRTFVRRREL